MIPDFTDKGLLPEGIHHASFEEFEKRFSYFANSDRRFRLFERLRELYGQVCQSLVVKRFLVGGSFVTSKPEPNDFDCILVLNSSSEWHDRPPSEYNLVSRQRARRLFGGDVIAVVEGSEDYREYMEVFQTTRDKNRVGIVEVVL